MEWLNDLPAWALPIAQVGVVLGSSVAAGVAYVRTRRDQQRHNRGGETRVEDLDTLIRDQREIAQGVEEVVKALRVIQGAVEVQFNLDRSHLSRIVTLLGDAVEELRSIEQAIGGHYRREIEELQRMHRILEDLARRKGD